MTSTAISMPNTTARFQDIESQAPARQFNPMATRAKIACMAIAGTAGVISTALLASMDPSAPDASNRQLLDSSHVHGCTPKQLANIETVKKALIYSGIACGSGFGAAVVGGCMMGAGSVGETLGTVVAQLGVTVTGLSSTAVVVSGIIYGVKKNDC